MEHIFDIRFDSQGGVVGCFRYLRMQEIASLRYASVGHFLHSNESKRI